MSARYQTTDILASPQQVWTQIRQAAENHTILYEKAPEMLIVQRDNQLHYIYYLTADPELTQLRLILTHDSDLARQATQAADVWQFLNTLPDENIGIVAWDAAQTHLLTIKARTQQIHAPAMSSLHNQPTQHAVKAVPFPVAAIVFVFFAFGGMVGAAFLLALNWLRLGQQRKAAYNSLFLLAGGSVSTPLMAGFMQSTQPMLRSGEAFAVAAYILGTLFVIWQLVQQQAHIEAWTRRTRIRPTWYRAGSGTVFLAMLGGFWLHMLWANALFSFVY